MCAGRFPYTFDLFEQVFERRSKPSMPAMLLPVIYLAFMSFGLPDSALGAAWPSMYADLGAGVSWVGLVSGIVAAGTIASSLMSARVVERFGTGAVVSVSVGLTAVGLLGFSESGTFWQLCLWAVPYGLGAGAVDAALNSYVAVHYASRHMSWLHCMWGVGTSVGPIIIAACLGGGTWADGFRAIGFIQVAITAVLLLSQPLWRRAEHAAGAASGKDGGGDAGRDAGESSPASHPLGHRELMRIPGVVEVLVCFFCYMGLETTCGAWAASYCSLVRGISAAQAAAWASFFYVGITVGRAASGFLTLRLTDVQLIRLGQAIIACGIVLVLLPGPDRWCAVGLVVIGLGCAPIYPSIIHATPARFGAERALPLTGLQMACAYGGTLLMSPLFGLLAEALTPALYPGYLAVLLALMVLMAERCNAKVGESHRV